MEILFYCLSGLIVFTGLAVTIVAIAVLHCQMFGVDIWFAQYLDMLVTI